MDYWLFFPALVSFLITFFLMPSWIRRAKNVGLEGKDMNKHQEQKVAEAGGVIAITGFVIGILVYVALKTFYFRTDGTIVEIFALTTSLIIIAFIGMIDDILGWKIGLNKKIRLILVMIGAIPLMVINAGESSINIPYFGLTNLGLIYPLLIIPLALVATSTTFNFLAGYNGLESSQGIIIIAGLSIVSYLSGNAWLGVIGLCMIASLLAFWLYNKCPAKVFPGDVLTYSVGALIAIMAILGNMERVALIFFIPYIIEVILKSRGKLKKESFAKPNPDNSLELPYDKIYGLEHWAIIFMKKIKKDGKVYEKDVVHLLNFLQVLFVIAGLLMFIYHLI